MSKLKLIIVIFFFCGCSSQKYPDNTSGIINKISAGLKDAVENFSEKQIDDKVSPRTVEDGTVVMVPSKDWTSGFFPGILWMMYELEGDNFWKESALQFTLPLEQEKMNGRTHDMGFKMYCSFGKAWHQTENPEYREILIQSAKTLSKRFQPQIGCIRSWDHNTDKWDFPVIIDNMMNLELLFWAAKETGNQMYKDIAVTHAETTMKNHFRPDYSTYHVVDYNPKTGEVQEKTTHQGYSAESAWSRGQAWGLYGYTMVFRETGADQFLQQAEKIASYILENETLPENKIPYWDFNAPNIPDEPYDASAAAIIASALYELSTFSANKDEYITAADKIMESLSSPGFFAPKLNNGFLLKHSTGSKPHNSEIDVPLVYADYYFIEALMRKINITTNS